jgi:hypothetical protein
MPLFEMAMRHLEIIRSSVLKTRYFVRVAVQVAVTIKAIPVVVREEQQAAVCRAAAAVLVVLQQEAADLQAFLEQPSAN